MRAFQDGNDTAWFFQIPSDDVRERFQVSSDDVKEYFQASIDVREHFPASRDDVREHFQASDDEGSITPCLFLSLVSRRMCKADNIRICPSSLNRRKGLLWASSSSISSVGEEHSLSASHSLCSQPQRESSQKVQFPMLKFLRPKSSEHYSDNRAAQQKFVFTVCFLIVIIMNK